MYDFCVIGGGIVGVATAARILEERPGSTLLLLEKADQAMYAAKHNGRGCVRYAGQA